MRETKVMTKLKTDQKGITLIAMVITIIVLLILAGVAISMLSGENGILKQAAEAKTETDEKSIVEAMRLAGITALTAGNGSVNNDNYYTTLNSELKELGYNENILNGDLPQEEIEVKGEYFTIKANGEVVHLAWWYEKDANGNRTDVITNGVQKLTLGDTVDYNPIEGLTKKDGVYKEYESKVEKNGYGTDSQIFKLENNTETTGQKLTWVVLGTDENGEVLIVPTKNIKDTNGETQWFNLKGQAGAQYGAEEVNSIAEIYGYGKGASGARAIQVEDINKLIGYDPNDVGEGKKYGSEEIYEYGNKVTYSWNTTTLGEVDYIGSNGEEGTFFITHISKGFNWFDFETKTWKNNKTFTGKITTAINTFYYNDNLSTTNCRGLYNVIADPDGEECYWLGSSFVFTGSDCLGYGVRYIIGACVDSVNLYFSSGAYGSENFGIRPAVSLKSDITFAPDGANSWTIQ